MENEYLDLPDDPEEAFATLHRKKFSELEADWVESDGRSNYLHCARKYVDIMIVCDDVYNLDILENYKSVPQNDNQFSEFFEIFRRHVNMFSEKVLMESARRQKAGIETIVVLDKAGRSAIHRLIQSIRERLETADLTEAKREALFNKLNAFTAEVDRNRTRAEAFYVFARDLARATREVNDELKPILKTIDKVFDWIDKAKKYADALPPWSERKKIEAPKKQLPKPFENSELDDEVPF